MNALAHPLLLKALHRFVAESPDVLLGRAGAQAIESKGRTPTVLCIHGFTGVPQEVALGCEVAAELGLSCVAPLLAGHGTRTDDLSRTTYADWLSGVRTEFDAARRSGPVILVGMSLGSLLATELCLSAPGDVLGLVLISNAFWLRAPYPRLALEFARRCGVPNLAVRKGRSDLGDPEALRTHISYAVQPVHAAIEVLTAGERLRAELHRVHRPTLILHGAEDRVCSVSNAWRVAQRLGTRDVRVNIFPHSHHILTRDVEKAQVARELRSFMKSVSP